MRRVLLFLVIFTIQSAHVFAGTKTWNNASGGNWNVDSNWTPSGVPTVTDIVYINLDGTYLVTYNANNVAVSAIYLGASSGTQTLFNPSNANGVTDTLHVLANGVFQMTGGSYTATRIINQGTVRLFGNFGPPIENQDSLLIGGTNVTLSGNLVNQGNVYVSNTGTFSLAGGSSTTSGNFSVLPGASISFNTGTHTLDASSSVSGAGNVTFSSTTTTLSSSYNITGLTSHTAGTTTFNGIPGSLVSLGDSLYMSGGTLNLITGDSIIVPKIRMNGSAAVLLVNAPIRFTESFTHNAGTVRGTGGTGVILVSPGLVYDIPTTTTTKWQKLTVLNEGTIQWSGSFSITLDSGVVINNYGLFNPQSTGTVTLNHNSGTMSQFNNYGTYRRSVGTTASNINALFNGFSGSAIEVQSGTLAFNQNSVFTDADASVSSGALLQINDTSSWDAASSITGAGNVEFSSMVTMSGTYNMGGYTSATGGTTTFDGTSGSLISIGDSLYMGAATLRLFTGDSVIVPRVRLNSLNAVLSLNAPLRFTETFTHNAGTLNGLDPSVAVIVSPGLIYNASTNSTTRWRRLTLLNEGTVQWSGTFSITLDSGTVINNYGLFDARSTSTTSLDHVNGVLSQFNNYGTFRRSVGSTVSTMDAEMNGFSGSLVEVQTGTFSLTRKSNFNDADASVSSGALFHFNTGVSSWDASSSISGAGNVQFSDTTVITGAYTITGITTHSGGPATFNGGSGSVGILDSVYVSSGTFTLSTLDTIRINRFQLSGGTLTGSAPIRINSVWNWTFGTVSGTDSTVAIMISSGAALNVSSGSSKTLSRRTVVNYATMTHTGSSFTHSNGAIFDNQPSGVIDLAGSNSGFTYGTGFRPKIKNSGLLKKSAGTASTISIGLENTNGRVEVQTTSLTLSDTSKWSNSVDTVFAGATLIFSGGTATKHTFDPSSRLAGYGNVTFSNGSATLSGTYDILGVSTFTGDTIRLNGADGTLQSLGDSVSVTGGTVTISTPDSIQIRVIRQTGGTFNANMGEMLDIDTLTLTGGTLTGNSPIRVTDYFTWSGGTMSATDSMMAIIIQTQALFNGGTHTLSKRTLINQGTITWPAGHWDNYNGAIIQNLSGSLIDIQGDNFNLNYISGSIPKFMNYGTLRKSAGTGTSSIQVQSADTNALIEIQAGILQFTANATYTNTDFVISNNRILQFNGGTQTLDSNSDITGTGAMRVYNGTNTLNGIYNVSDSSYFIGGTTTFSGAPASLQNVGAKLRVDGGTANFANGDSIIVQALLITGGAVDGYSPMRVTNSVNLTAGELRALDSTVTTDVASGATFTINGGFVYFNKRTVTTHTNIDWNTGVIRMINGAVLNIQPGTVFDIKANNYMEFSTSSRINNRGTFRKSGGSGTSSTDVLLTNTNGLVEAKVGTIELRSNTVSDHSVLTIDSAATLIFTNTGAGLLHEMDSTSIIKGKGTLRVASGTVNFRDTIDVQGETYLTGGTSTFSGPPGTLINLGKRLTVNGTAYFNRDTLKIDTLLTSGTLGGTAPIIIKSKFVLTGGVVTSTDSATTLTIPVGATFYWSANGSFQRRTINNYGTAIWTSPWGLDDNAVYNNMPGALTDWTVDGNTNWFGGTSNNFNNFGTLRKSGGTGISSFEYYVNNYGLIEVQTGTLYFGAGGTHAGGDFILSPGSTIDFAAGNHTFNAASSVTGTGTVLISPTTFTMDGIYDIIGSTTIGGGTINFDSTFSTTVRTTVNGGTTNFKMMPGHFLGVGNKMNVAGGTVNFITTDSLKVDTLLVNGTLGGNNHWYVRHQLTLTGTLTSPDSALTVTIPVGSTFYYNNGTLERRTINNSGTAIWNNPVMFMNSTVYNNLSGALTDWTADGNSNWFFASSRPFFNNYGTFRKTGGTGVSSFEYDFNNYGLVEIQTGTMQHFTDGKTVNGDYIISAGARLWLSGGTHTIDSLSTVTGAGNLQIENTSTFNGTINVGRLTVGDLGSSNGFLVVNARAFADTADVTGNVQGTDTLTVRKKFRWLRTSFFTSGSMTGSGVTEALDSLFIEGGQEKTLSRRTLITRGPTIWTGTGNIRIDSGAVINNQNVFDAKNDQTLYQGSGPQQPNLNNYGTFKKSGGTGITTIQNVNFNNYGTLQVDSTLTFTQSGDTLRNTLNADIQGKGTLDISNASTIFINDGHVRPGTSPGVLKVTGNYQQSNDGTFDVEIEGLGSGNHDSLSVNGIANLNGTLAITILNGFVPSINDTFKIMKYESYSGNFSAITGDSIGSGIRMVPEYRANELVMYASNANPVATTDFVSLNEDDSINIFPLSNDTDVDGDSLIIQVVSDAPLYGSYTILGDTIIRYVPNANFNGTDSLAYKVIDKNGGNDSGKVYITINAVNDPPIVANSLRDTTYTEDFTKKFISALTDVFSDVDNSLTYGASNLSVGVTPFISNDSLYVLSTSFFNGVVDIRVTAFDGEYTVADTFAADVSGINNAPSLSASFSDTILTEDFGTVFLAALAVHFGDIEGDPLVYSIESISGGVTAQITNDTLFLQSVSNFHTGPAIIRITASDGQFSVSDTFDVFVTPVNDPVTLSGSFGDLILIEDFAKTFVANLNSKFTDLDGITPAYSAAILDSGVTSFISGDSLYLNSVAGFLGQVIVKIQATDTLTIAADTFQVTVNPANFPPVVVQSIKDSVLDEDFGTVFVKMTGIFNDPESSTLLYSANVLGGGASVYFSQDSLFLVSADNFNGFFDIRVTASDGDKSISDTFKVTINPVNDAPHVASVISDQILIQNFGKVYVTSLNVKFNDVDNDPLNFSVTNLDSGVTTVLSNDSLYLNSVPDFLGQVRVRTTADDGALLVADTFFVTVNPANFPPTLVASLADTSFAEDFGKVFVAVVSPLFNDVDDTVLIYGATALGAGVSSSISNDSIYLNSSADFNGSVNIRVHASDGFNTTADTFTITITPLNDAPTKNLIISDITIPQDFGTFFAARLTSIFSDIDNGSLTYGVSTLNAGVDGFISSDTLYILSTTAFTGASTLRVTADDGEFTIADTFVVNVTSVDAPPIIVQALRDTSFSEGFPITFVYDLNTVFTDDGVLTFTAQELSAGVATSISEDSLFITGNPNFFGTVLIKITADDGQFTLADTFAVTVYSVNDPPIVQSSLRDTSLAEDFATAIGSVLSMYFDDPDNDPLNYLASALDPGVSAAMSGDTLQLFSEQDFNGTARIAVRADDGQYTIRDTFVVTVTPVNDVPILTLQLPDVILTEDFGKTFAGVLLDYFSDVDNSLNYAASNLDAGVTTLISNDSLYLFSTFNFSGTARIMVTADDGQFTISDTLVVTVTPNNQPPVLVAVLRDTTLNEDFGRIFYAVLTNYFSDADLDVLTFPVSSSSVGVVPTIQNDSLYLTGTINFNGTATVYVSVTDGSGSIEDSFRVIVSAQNDEPSIFALLAPANNMLTSSLRPLFRWNTAKDIDGDVVQYLLEISTQQNFSALSQFYTLTDTIQTLTSDLDSTGTYYWRVTANDQNGGVYQTGSFTLRVDGKKPNLNISLLQGTVVKRYLDAYAYSSEDLSGAVNSSFTLRNNSGTIVDSRSIAMTKIGTTNFYTSSYHLQDPGNLDIQVTAQDLAGNQRISTRLYTVNAFGKGQPFTVKYLNAEIKITRPVVSESGFIIVTSYDEQPSCLMPSLDAGIELIGTIELKDPLNISLRYDEQVLNSLKADPAFDEKKIGIYRVTESGFDFAGGQGHNASVSASVNAFGKYVVLYNTNHTVIPDKIELSQNYPNPFNPSTTIQYGLATTGKVRLVIYNVLGQRVRELIDANQPAGYHKIIWDGRNASGQIVATGMYIYRLETPDGALSRKMMLIK